MNSALIILALLALTANCQFFRSENLTQKPNPVPFDQEIDLNRFMGTWYEIQRLPNAYENSCYCNTASFSWKNYKEETKFDFAYTCNHGSASGPRVGTHGFGSSENKENSVLDVVMFEYLHGTNIILDVDTENYEWAMLSSKGDARTLMLNIYSRKPTLDQDTLQNLVQLAKSQGWPVDTLQSTPQQGCDN